MGPYVTELLPVMIVYLPLSVDEIFPTGDQPHCSNQVFKRVVKRSYRCCTYGSEAVY